MTLFSPRQENFRFFQTTLLNENRNSSNFYGVSHSKTSTRSTEPFIPLNPLLDGIFRTTNWGLPEHTFNIQGESTYTYDFNSMYAAILAYLPIPGGIPLYFEEPLPLSFEEFQKNLNPTELAFCWASIEAPETPNQTLPYTVPQWTRSQGKELSLWEEDSDNITSLHSDWFYSIHGQQNPDSNQIPIQDPSTHPHHQVLFPNGTWWAPYHSFMLEYACQQGFNINVNHGFIFQNLNKTIPQETDPWNINTLYNPQEEISRALNPSQTETSNAFFRNKILTYYAYRLYTEGNKTTPYQTVYNWSPSEQLELQNSIRDLNNSGNLTRIEPENLLLSLENFDNTFFNWQNDYTYFSEIFLFEWPDPRSQEIQTAQEFYPLFLPSSFLQWNSITSQNIPYPDFDLNIWWQSSSNLWSPNIRSPLSSTNEFFSNKTFNPNDEPFTWIPWSQSSSPDTLSISWGTPNEDLPLQWTQNWNQILNEQQSNRTSQPTLEIPTNSWQNLYPESLKNSFYKEILAQAHGFQGTQPRFSYLQASNAQQNEIQNEWAQFFFNKTVNQVPPIFLLTYLSNPYYWEYNGPNSMILASAIYAHASLLITNALTLYNTTLYWNSNDTLTVDSYYPAYTLQGDLGYMNHPTPDANWISEEENQWTSTEPELTYPHLTENFTEKNRIEWSQLKIPNDSNWSPSHEWNPSKILETLEDLENFPLGNYCLFLPHFLSTPSGTLNFSQKFSEGDNWYRVEWPQQKSASLLNLNGDPELHPWTLRYPQEWPSLNKIQTGLSSEESTFYALPFLSENELIDINWLLNSLSPEQLSILLGIRVN